MISTGLPLALVASYWPGTMQRDRHDELLFVASQDIELVNHTQQIFSKTLVKFVLYLLLGIRVSDCFLFFLYFPLNLHLFQFSGFRRSGSNGYI